MFIRIRQVLLFIHYLLVQGLHHYVASRGSAKYLAHARLPRTTLNRNMQNQTHKRKCCCRATRERYFRPVGNVKPRCRPLPLSENCARNAMVSRVAKDVVPANLRHGTTDPVNGKGQALLFGGGFL